MDKKQSDKKAAFDTLYTTNHIQMLKILIPVFGKEMRHKIAVYIKFMEWQYTLSLAKSSPHSFNLCAESETSSVNFEELLDEIFPFCTEKEQTMFKNLKNMQATLKQYKEMEATMSMMKDMFPEGMSMDNMDLDFFSMFQNKED